MTYERDLCSFSDGVCGEDTPCIGYPNLQPFISQLLNLINSPTFYSSSFNFRQSWGYNLPFVAVLKLAEAYIRPALLLVHVRGRVYLDVSSFTMIIESF